MHRVRLNPVRAAGTQSCRWGPGLSAALLLPLLLPLLLLLLQVREANQMVEEMMLLANCTGE